MTMADTVAVMNRGRIEQMGAPEELYELPRTVFVANFLGQSNLFQVEVAGSTDQVLRTDFNGVPISVPRARSARDGGSITIGVRPEKLTLSKTPLAADASTNAVGPGRIVDVSFIGVSTQYTVELPGAGPVQVFAQNLQAGPTAALGDEVWLSWHIEHTFGLADDRLETGALTADFSTRAIAAQAAHAE